ncbi:hypothetical protein [Microbacterium tumbae]
MTRILAVFATVLAVSIGSAMPASAAPAAAAQAGVSTLSMARSAGDATSAGLLKTSLVGFNPGNIISDAVFTNKGTMTEAQIQAFFDSKVKKCVVGNDEKGKPIVCLKDFRITSVDRPADSYCSGYEGAANESAARIIYKTAQACGINPQVLIVMLQKEQGLVTHTWPSGWRYNAALGQGCPDTAPCDPSFVGFFHQIYGAARQMQIYMEGKHFTWYAPGKTWGILYNPKASCGRGNVYVANKATSALYYYTPYQPNAAALRAGYGEGDSCSAYGNRNFYNYFTDWFGSTQKPASICGVPGDVRSAQLQYVTTTGLNARKSPATACDDDVFTLSAGTILQARRVTADGDWIEVLTLEGPRWVSREFLRTADAEEAECTLPPGTSGAERQYVVLSSTAAKLAPWAACDLRSSTLGVGTVVQATRVSSSGKWLEVQTSSGPRWVERSAVGYATSADVDAVCVDPAATSGASGEYVVRTSQMAWVSPLAKCGAGQQLGVGTVLQATRLSYSGDWLEVQTQSGLRWVARSGVEAATSADVDAACVDPAGTSTATDRYVVRTSGLAWVSPLAKCGTGAKNVGVGTVLQATRLSSSGKWLEVRTSAGTGWVARDSVAMCADPAGTKKASKQYVVQESTQALVSPLAECGTAAAHWGAGTAPSTLGVGTVVQATRVSSSGKWLEVQTSSGPRWVERSAVGYATSADVDAVCVDPAATSGASGEYVVRTSQMAWVSPLAKCGAGQQLGVGTVLQATRLSYSGDWLEVQTQSGLRWVARSGVEAATSADVDAACVDPAGTSTATDRYVVRTSGLAWVSPLAKCGTGAKNVGVGTVLQATRLSSSGKWLEVRTSAGTGWVARDSVAMCADPAGTKKASKQYVVQESTQALVSPLAECGTAAAHWGAGTAPSTLGVGTVVQATRVSSSGKWLEVQTSSGPRWVLKEDVRER